MQSEREAEPVADRPQPVAAIPGAYAGSHRVECVGVQSGFIGRRGSQLLLVGALALVTRLLPLVVHHQLTAQLEYDDAVHFSAAQHFLSGQLPYRDFVFVQPPGIVILLAPFAALARMLGDQNALAIVRVLVACLGTANALLLMRVLRNRPTAGLVAGLLYAAWGAAAYSERTVLLEPLLNLFLLAALLMIRRHGRAMTYGAGALLGVALAIKLWAAVDIVVIALYLTIARRPSRLMSWSSGVVTGAAIFSLPLIVFAPSQFIRQTIHDQLGRPKDPVPFAFRFSYFRLFVDHSSSTSKILTGLLTVLLIPIAWAVLLPILQAVRLRVHPRVWPEPPFWSVLAFAQVATITVSPSTFYHYTDFALPPICLLTGLWIADELSRPQAIWRRRIVRTGLVTALVAATVGSVRYVYVVAPASATTREFAATYRCTWFLTQSAAEAADAATRSVQQRCPGWVDAFGVALDSEHGKREPVTVDYVKGLNSWQLEVRAQIARSDAAILPGELADQPFSAETIAAWNSHFRFAGRADQQTLWKPA